MSQKYRYEAYGLLLESSIPLPELCNLECREEDAQVYVRQGNIDFPISLNGEPSSTYIETDQCIYFFWREVGKFSARNGKEIIVDLEPDIEPGLGRLPLLGPVLAALLHQRGFLVLHASAVAIDRRAVAFVGNKGWGKSTSAAALHARGHPLVSDDVLAVEFSDSGPQVPPAFPRLKLWPEAAEAALEDDPNRLPPIHSRVSKRARTARERFQNVKLPLARIYVLDRGKVLTSESLPPQRAFLALIRHTYNQKILRSSIKEQATHFRQCTQLAKQVDVRSLKRPVDLNALSEIAQLVEHDIRGTSS